MDLETENRLAALLMEEARRLRAEADKEGVHAYLCQPNVRGRPNPRFLTATVLGVEQANRAVEVNEMWRAREKELELELDARLKSRAKDKDVYYGDKNHGDSCKKVQKYEEEACRSSTFTSTSKHGHVEDSCYSSEDDGLKNDEVEEFLRSRWNVLNKADSKCERNWSSQPQNLGNRRGSISARTGIAHRAKRGRGAIGSRMDEPGPYRSATSLDHDDGKLLADPDTREREEWERRILGPEKPGCMKPHKLPTEKVRDMNSSKKKHHSKDKNKKRSKEERSERRKTKEEEKCKHRHNRSRRSKSGSE